MPKVLYISNISGEKHSVGFSGSAMYALKNLGYEFHYAANRAAASEEQTRKDELEYGIKLHHIDLSRAPYSLKNIKAYKQLCSLIKKEKYDFIHCNTPTGGLLGRLAGKKCKVKTVIYQAHGFHFYKGAPRLNQIIYYPIEKFLARYTDALITINTEDFKLAKEKFKLKNGGRIYYVPGVGIDIGAFKVSELDIEKKRKEIGLAADDKAFISAGRLDVNKNNETTIRAIAKTKTAKLVLCGDGVQMDYLKSLAKELGVCDRVLFLGNRTDVNELYKICDGMIMMSFREGLSRSIMEAMSVPLPCIVSKIRGNVDLIDERKGGILCSPTDADALAEAIELLCNDSELCEKMKEYNLEKIKNFDITKVVEEMSKIYRQELCIK